MSVRNAKVITTNMDNRLYHEYQVRADASRGDDDYVMSRSDLMEFAVCPMRWRKGYETNGTTATEWGQMLDIMVTNPSRFDDLIAVADESYTDANGITKPYDFRSKDRQQWKADREAEGKLVVKYPVFMEAKDAHKALMSDPSIEAVLFNSSFQVFITGDWKDWDTGLTVPLKALIDFVPDVANGPFGKTIGDFKTARNADLGVWSREVWQRNYHVQAAFYIDLYCAATGEDRSDFLHIILENVEPYAVGRRLLSSEFINLGREKYIAALRHYCQCIERSRWPGYDDDRLSSFYGWSITDLQPWMTGALEPFMMRRLPDDDPKPSEQNRDTYV